MKFTTQRSFDCWILSEIYNKNVTLLQTEPKVIFVLGMEQ